MQDKRRLTKKIIDGLTTTKKGGERFYDGQLSGFGVQVHPTGKKSFFLDYNLRGGRRRRMKIGAYGPMTLEDARIEAMRILALVHAGTDPLDERLKEKTAGTFSKWADEYLALGKAAGRWESKIVLPFIKNYLRIASEDFGNKRLADVDAATLERFRDKMHRERGLTSANKALSVAKACLREAWKRDLIPSNEAAKVSRISGELPRTRTLSDKEMKMLVEAVERHTNPSFRVALLWLILTGARRSEVLRAKWVDLRLDPPERAEWTIPSPKNKRPSVRPIPVELVQEIEDLPKTSPLVLGDGWTLSRFTYSWNKIRESAGLPSDIHLHDLRRTAGLWIARTAGLQAAQRLLGHSNISTTAKVYTPLTTDDLRGPQAEVVAKILPFRKSEKKGRS